MSQPTAASPAAPVPGYVGIDVAKAHLDIALHQQGKPWRVPNDVAGIADTVSRTIAGGATALIGLMVVKIVQPGAGINANASTLDAKAVAQYATSGQQLHTVDFLLNIIPETIVGAFARGEILQILFIAILFGIALASFEQGKLTFLTPLEGRVLGAIRQVAFPPKRSLSS